MYNHSDWVLKLLRVANGILNRIIVLMILVAAAYGVLGLWDAYTIYADAGADSEILKYKPQIDNEQEDNPSLTDLQKINPDVCGWLTIDDTNIDYPVVQGETNMTYINQAVDGSFSLAGSVFLDCQNSFDFSDPYSLVYAHHIEGDVMFGVLPEFQKADFFQKHTSGTLYLTDKTYDIELFACVFTDAYDRMVFDPAKWSEETSILELLDYVKEKSVQYRNISWDTQTGIIALSTCYDAETDGRILVFGQLQE